MQFRIVLLLGALVGLFAAPITRADNIDTKPLDVLGAVGLSASRWPDPLRWLRISSQNIFSDGRPHFTGQMAWLPTYQYDPATSLSLHLGVSPLPRKAGNEHSDFYVLTDVHLLYGYLFPSGRYSVEAGPGVQYWVNTDVGNSAMFGTLNVNGVYHFRRAVGGFVDGIFLGFSVVYSEYSALEQIKLGVVIH